jgi:hypothetical protein
LKLCTTSSLFIHQQDMRLAPYGVTLCVSYYGEWPRLKFDRRQHWPVTKQRFRKFLVMQTKLWKWPSLVFCIFASYM